MNLFYLFGLLLAGWALLVSALGIFVHRFPGKAGEKIVLLISAVLVVLAVGSAIHEAGQHEKEGGGEEAAAVLLA